MSSKINIYEIAKGHFDTLRDSDGKRSYIDLFTFILIPLAFGVVSALLSFNLNKDLSSLLVNFGSIFTALLLSVLVLVYDQESKLEDRKDKDGFYNSKKVLLNQLYYNISYSILCSVALVLLCFVHSVILGLQSSFSLLSHAFTIRYDMLFITPFVVIVTTNLFLNIIMIVKRMHALLISQ